MTTSAHTTLSAWRYRVRAQKWRNENGIHPESGIVVFFAGEVQGWLNTRRDPHRWRPGSIAVDGQGKMYVATGGNDYDGAERWERAP